VIPLVDRAWNLSVYIKRDRGQWHVCALSYYPDQSVKEHAFGAYHTQRQAEIAVRWIEYAANRLIIPEEFDLRVNIA
jgi:hypothetical protein